MRRDSQKSKVYDAEHLAETRCSVLVERLSPQECEKLVKLILSRKFLSRRYRMPASVSIDYMNGGAGLASIWGASIILGRDVKRGGTRRSVVLHEMAHVLQGRSREWSGGGEPHGWQFTSTMLLVVQTVCGKAVADELKRCYREKRARVTRPRKGRSLTDAEKAARAEGLARGRALREERRRARLVVIGRWPGQEHEEVLCIVSRSRHWGLTTSFEVDPDRCRRLKVRRRRSDPIFTRRQVATFETESAARGAGMAHHRSVRVETPDSIKWSTVQAEIRVVTVGEWEDGLRSRFVREAA